VFLADTQRYIVHAEFGLGIVPDAARYVGEMPNETYPPDLQEMIDRAGTLTVDETQAMGDLWESEEELVLPAPSLLWELQGGLDEPEVTNQDLLDAWQRALHAASNADPIRLDAIEAARAAGRAATHDERHLHDSRAEKNGAEQAVRSAVLAVGVRDLISASDFTVLAGPWGKVLGAL
jgi:hypothetical protein